MKDDNRKFWERIAKIYTIVQEKGNKQVYQTFCQRLKPFIGQNHNVLELACGTGQVTAFLAHCSRNWIATDFSEKMIHEAKIRLDLDNVSFEVQDATNLSYDNQTFDIVLIANALHIMPELQKALKAIKRVLKYDGILIAPTFVYEKGEWHKQKAIFDL